jgi:hypothetical protein
MAKRRPSAGGEVSLFPFLSILACLIGTLIIIIVVLSVAQTQQSDGRTKEELDQAREYQELLRKEKEQKEIEAILTDKLAKLEKIKIETVEKEQRLAKLRKLLATSADVKKMNQELGQNLLKELDNLLLEIEGLTKQEVDVKKEIAALMEEIKARQVPLTKVVPPVVVQPSGSGLAQGTKLFFVEASSGKLTIFWDQKRKTVVSATDEVIAADAAYNHLLTEVLKVPQSRIIFLLRDDGMAAFNKAAGWAQATYNYRVDQIGRLLLPGRGEVDLQMFRDFLGVMPPPPEAKLVAPPAATAPKAAAPKADTPKADTPKAAAPAGPEASKPAAPAPSTNP